MPAHGPASVLRPLARPSGAGDPART